MLEFLLIFVSLWIVVTAFHRYKKHPDQTRTVQRKYRVPEDKVKFLWNLTWYEKGVRFTEHNIFGEILAMIENAKKRIIYDVFLLTELVPPTDSFQPTSTLVSEALIDAKRENPDLFGMVITDPVNTFYGTDHCRPLYTLSQHGFRIVVTDTDKLPDNNLLYSGLWHIFFRWFKTGSRGLLPHPLKPTRSTTLRALLKAFNVRANHRKVLVVDNSVLISSSNIDNKSSFYNDTGIKISDANVAEYYTASELEVARFSGEKDIQVPPIPVSGAQGEIEIEPQLGHRIKEAILKDIGKTRKGDTIAIAMLFVSHRQIIGELKKAVARGVIVEMILDRNIFSFGTKKIGYPNRFNAYELVRAGITVRWYQSRREEFHSKLIAIFTPQFSIFHFGSANLTRRSLLGTNLESNIRILTSPTARLSHDIRAYFDRIGSDPFSRQYLGGKPHLFALHHLFGIFAERTGISTY